MKSSQVPKNMVNSKGTKGKYFAVRIFILVVLIVSSIWVGGIEYLHHKQFGHFVSYGLHVDALNRYSEIGIPGQTQMYWPRLYNYTIWPVKLVACNYVTDAMRPGTEYPYAVQRWNVSSNSWETIVEVNGESFCYPYPLGMAKTDLISERLWPGISVDVMEGEATGARESFQKGDQARFVVFTTTNKSYASQTALTSVPFVIQDQVIRGDSSFRLKH